MKPIVFQYFEWNIDVKDKLWNQLKSDAEELKACGVDYVWLPPAYKAHRGDRDAGYGVYDLYDLGEFDQKGSVATKYGTKEEYFEAITKLKSLHIGILPDIVFNHKMGADDLEEVRVEVIDPMKRQEVLNDKKVKVWTKFNFPGRDNKYSSFKWNHHHFKGVDYAQNHKVQRLYLFEGKKWDENVDLELTNYDYLMGADVDVLHEEVFNELVSFGQWYYDVIDYDGFRLDAVKHIHFGFFNQWLKAMDIPKDLLVIGEYWSDDVRALHNYLMEEEYSMKLFDVPLHYNFYEASLDKDYDMRKIFNNSLLINQPDYAITFVDNHDTQPNQSLESWIKPWFKPLAYALILLRPYGIPTVFYGDFYGMKSDDYPEQTYLPLMMKLRKRFVDGEMMDYFDDREAVGWSFLKSDGLVVLMSNKKHRLKKMFIGHQHAGKTFINVLNPEDEVLINNKGIGMFAVDGKRVALYLERKIAYEYIL